MAILSDPDRLAGAADFSGDISAAREAIAVCTKTDIRAAFNAYDQFISDNQAAINNALPATAKANLTVPQKARLMLAVIRKRYLTGT